MSTLVERIRSQLGQTFPSAWLTVEQSMIDRFADVTSDHQFIHVDPVRAATTPFGGTVAHGLLTLSLLPRLRELTPELDLPGISLSLNYGFDRVRFVSPVRSGSRIRGLWQPKSIDEKGPSTYQILDEVTVELDGRTKPAMFAAWMIRFTL